MSLSAVTAWLMMAGSMIFTACGIRMICMTCDFRMPMAYAASDCPFGRALMPARNTSASTAPL